VAKNETERRSEADGMVCGRCGATIAEKAIVCYRCGEPTAIPEAPRRPAASPERRAPVAAMILAAVTAGLGWVAIDAPPESIQQVISGGGAALSGLGSAYLFVRRRRR
jgi:ribosomal protein L40E